MVNSSIIGIFGVLNENLVFKYQDWVFIYTWIQYWKLRRFNFTSFYLKVNLNPIFMWYLKINDEEYF